MPTQVFSAEVSEALAAIRQAALEPREKEVVLIDGTRTRVPYPFPSPQDWRDRWIYFLMVDRFAAQPGTPPRSTAAQPPSAWDSKYGYRQGGTFKGIQHRLGYLQELGVGAIWLTPVVKNAQPEDWQYNYHGYGAQDFLNLDPRFASDGTLPTAERELTELVEEAHARDIHVIADVVLNHAGRVFDYLYRGQVVSDFQDPAVIGAPLGEEPSIRWINGLGVHRADWQDRLPPPAELSEDDAVWPVDLQRLDFFRRRGRKLSDAAPPAAPIVGDFDSLRQLVTEYDAGHPGLEEIRRRYGRYPVLGILIRACAYLIARYDLDGFRIDTVKYLAPDVAQTFGNAMRELALTAGKRNFFTFGEVYDSEATISRFVGRNSSEVDGFGIDAALDFPLFYTLPGVAKGLADVGEVRRVFAGRKEAQKGHISSHGEAGRYFVSFLDNHDQRERFHHPDTPLEQVSLGLGLLFTLQGIPCLYYGTEQGLTGTKDQAGHLILNGPESVREALWGRPGEPFGKGSSLHETIRRLSSLRAREPAIRYGRIYFREVSANGRDFGHSWGPGGVVAFSRILSDREVLVVANTSPTDRFAGHAVVDLDLNPPGQDLRVAFSNLGTVGTRPVEAVEAMLHREDGSLATTATRAASLDLRPMEVQVLGSA